MILKIIGRRDHIDLPDLKLSNLEAKIDTGAYGCALHCHDVEITVINNIQKLRFQLLDPSHPEYEDRSFYFEVFGQKEVKNSFGSTELRYTIKTPVKIFKTIYLTEFSLTDRIQMKYPILLGRKFLSKQFIVDVNRKNISSNQKNN